MTSGQACLNQDLPDLRVFRIRNPVHPFILKILIQTMGSLIPLHQRAETIWYGYLHQVGLAGGDGGVEGRA